MGAFRNLAISPEADVDDWGVEGMLAAIDRGDLESWGRIAQAVREAPDGSAAADLEQALDLAEDAGVAAVLRRVLAEARGQESAALARSVRAWVSESGLTRAQLADRVGTSRSRLSTYESGKVVPSAVTARKIRSLAARRRAHLV